MRLIIALLFALMLFGCSSTKRLNKSQNIDAVDSSKVVHQRDSVATSHKNKTAQTIENLSSNEDFDVTIKEYDTNKPTDSATGKPPLKREIKASRKKQTNAESKHNEKILERDSTAMAERDTTDKYSWFRQNSSEILEQKTKFSFPWWGVFGGIAVAFLIIGAIKLWKSNFWRMR